MQRKILGNFVAVLALLLLSAALALAAPASVRDDASLLTAAEKAQVEQSLAAVERSHGVHIAICTAKTLGNRSAGDAANALVDEIGAGAEHGAIALVLAMDTRDYYIATDAAMRERILDGAGIDALSGSFVEKLSAGEYAAGFTAFAEKTGEMLSYYEENGKPYDPSDAFSPVALGIAALLAAGVFFLVRSWLLSSMDNVRRETKADAYVEEGSFALTESRDTFLYEKVERRKKPKPKEKTSSRDAHHGGGGGKF